MWRHIKRVFFVLLTLVVLGVAGFIIAFAVTVAGDSPMSDSETLGGRTKQIKDGFSSAGVIDTGAGTVALVDCGTDKAAKTILAELGRRNLGKEAVKAIFLTHGHPDHTGGCAVFGGADVYALAAEKDLVEGRTKANAPLSKLMPRRDTGARVTRTLTDGQEVTVGDVVVTAYALPGHTAGSAAYLADGVLFLGDGAAANKNGKLTPAKYLFSDDQAQANASLVALARKLEPRAAEVKTLELAHTGTLLGLQPLRDFASAHP